MIITVQDIRQYREIAANTQQNRVEVFIKECEQLDIMPAIGADEYERLNTVPATELTEQEKMLLAGGTWEDADGRKHVFKGLKAAECYLTFARFIRMPCSFIKLLAFFTISGRTRNSRFPESGSFCKRSISSSINRWMARLVCTRSSRTYRITISNASSLCDAVHSHPFLLASAKRFTSSR